MEAAERMEVAPVVETVEGSSGVEVIEALSTSLIESKHYRRITSEIEEMWRTLDRYQYEIDVILGNGRFFAGLNALFHKVFQLENLPAQSSFEASWKLFCRFYIKRKEKFISDSSVGEQ